jgi:uncharacterized membrane protein
MNRQAAQASCSICQQPKKPKELVHGDLVREAVVEQIRKVAPHWTSNDLVCHACLHRFRSDYVQSVLEVERGELSEIESEVLRGLREQEVLARDVNCEYEQALTLGQRWADRIAVFGGSWRFILSFGAVLVLWIVLNTVVLLQKPFDPYPFILLNLVLSCLAALQAPVIMMSQNRQEAKDRLRAENDYRVNLKAELEIRHLHAKIDQLLTHQWQRLVEIQRIQMDILQEMGGKR